MFITQLAALLFVISITVAVDFQANPTSDNVSNDEKNVSKGNKTIDSSDESSHEIETDTDEIKENKFLEDAMKTVLDPQLDPTTIFKTNEKVENFKLKLEEINKSNANLSVFMHEMDKLSLHVCKHFQNALWSYITDINNDAKKSKMVRIAAQEDEVKKQYWHIFKTKYLNYKTLTSDPKLMRKLRIIKERDTNAQMPHSKQREEIDTMQRIWRSVTVCPYNSQCTGEDSIRTMSDIITIFKTSNDSKELAYYWKVYHDSTGKKIRPIFKDYVNRMNKMAELENFTDAGDMWRYAFEDEHFVKTIDKIWKEIKPLYDLLHDYVRAKLKVYYKEDFKSNINLIPAHILGNLWGHEWQSIYPKVEAYPSFMRPKLRDNKEIYSKDLFDTVDVFHQSLGFKSAKDSYRDLGETTPTANCVPSSHDMCDGVHYKIKWCNDKVSDVVVDLSRAARLLGHVQYFKHYKNQPPLYRDGPNPAFHDAISDIIAIQLTRPEYLTNLGLVKVDTGSEVTLNHLLWVALEKIPLMAYAYVLDKWRWDVFGNSSLENWNEHWWDLRIKETGVSPPMPRNESDLDPAAKYHVVSHLQYITYLVSYVLEFQILLSLCKRANHTGPLHECSIYGVKDVGKLLSDGMKLGASEDWRTVLKTMTGETELSTEGFLEYFSALQDFFQKENVRLAIALEDDLDKRAPIIVGVIVVILTLFIVLLYCAKKHDLGRKFCSLCSISRNGTLDIATNDISQGQVNDVEYVSEDNL